MMPVSYQSGSGCDGGSMAGFAPAAVNLEKVRFLTRLGQTGGWLVDPGHVSRPQGACARRDGTERTRGGCDEGPADRARQAIWRKARPVPQRPAEQKRQISGIRASNGLHFACAFTPGRTSKGRCVVTVSLNPALPSS